MNIIEVNNLRKVYKSFPVNREVTALKSLDLNVSKGSIFGLLGPNGAGKTTLIKILLGITHKTNGEAKILGEDIKNYKVRSSVGYLAENHKYPPFMKGEEMLRFFARLGGYDKPDLNKKIENVLSLVDMSKWKRTKLKNYSKGMMQRIGLAQAMINDPELIFLDEPTDGVDPVGRKEIRDIIHRLQNEGKTIFLNSHLLSEVELICDRVAILNKGELIKSGTVDEITKTGNEFKIEYAEKLSDHIITNLSAKYPGINIGERKLILNTEDLKEINSIIDLLRSENVIITDLTKTKHTLEESFIQLVTGGEAV